MRDFSDGHYANLRTWAWALLCALPLWLAGCGGGGSGVAATSPPTTTPTTTPTTPSATLSASVSSLALSVNDPASNPALTGNPRIITVTNTGSVTATDVTVGVAPALPSGTTIASTCTNLPAAASCTITVTPGATPSAPSGVTAPAVPVATIAASNGNSLRVPIQVLGYGSVYQGGYVFAIDDTTPDTGSVGGKVAALGDASAALAWGGLGTATGASSLSDGQTNTATIVAVLGMGNYAAYACTQPDHGYTDWYLPAICEMDTAPGCPASGQTMQLNLVNDGNVGALSGSYWSSYEYPGSPTSYAWEEFFAIAGGNAQSVASKGLALQVRCVRQLTP